MCDVVNRRTYMCKYFDGEKQKCVKWEWGNKCSQKSVRYCFKNYPEFFEEMVIGYE